MQQEEHQVKQHRRQHRQHAALTRVHHAERHHHQRHNEDGRHQREAPVQFGARAVGVGFPQGAHIHLFGVVRIGAHRLVADNSLIVIEVGNAEVAQHRGAFKAGALVEGHHLRAVFLLRQLAGIRHHHRGARIAFRTQLGKEDVMEAVAVDAFDKHHRVTIAGLLELALGQRRHTGVSFSFGQHFVLMARRPRPRPHNVDRRHRAGEQREDHRRLD